MARPQGEWLYDLYRHHIHDPAPFIELPSFTRTAWAAFAEAVIDAALDETQIADKLTAITEKAEEVAHELGKLP